MSVSFPSMTKPRLHEEDGDPGHELNSIEQMLIACLSHAVLCWLQAVQRQIGQILHLRCLLSHLHHFFHLGIYSHPVLSFLFPPFWACLRPILHPELWIYILPSLPCLWLHLIEPYKPLTFYWLGSKVDRGTDETRMTEYWQILKLGSEFIEVN